MLSKSEIPGKHKPRKQLPVRSVSCPSAGQSLKTVAPEPVKKDKSKASKIPKKQSPRSQTRSCGRWWPPRLHDHFNYPRLLHSPKLRVWVSGFGWYNIITTGIIQSALRIRWHKPKHQWEASTYQGSWVNVWFEWDGPHLPIVLRHLNTGGVALLEEVRHSLGQGRVQATVCFLCIPFSLCSLLAVQLVECSVAAYLHAFLPGWALIPLEPSCQIIFLLWAALVMVFLSEQQKKKNN